MLLPRDQLERQYSCNAVQPHTYTSSGTAATVRSAIPDPDVSQSCGDSLEYVDSTTLLATTVDGHSILESSRIL